MITFEEFKQEWIAACHNRNACKEGYAELLKSNSVPEILSVAKNHWFDVNHEMFFKVIEENIERWYADLKTEFNQAGIWVNEEIYKGIVVVNNYNKDEPLCVRGSAKAYIFGASKVNGFDKSEIYCHSEGSEITLYNNSYGRIEKGRVLATDRSNLEMFDGVNAVCMNYATVTMNGGFLEDKGHCEINAYLDSEIKPLIDNSSFKMYLHDNAKIVENYTQKR